MYGMNKKKINDGAGAKSSAVSGKHVPMGNYKGAGANVRETRLPGYGAPRGHKKASYARGMKKDMKY